jgi:glutathione peroxidase
MIFSRLFMTALVTLVCGPVTAFTFTGIEGDTIDLDAFRGQPVLVVNTASRCGFTPQLEALQDLHEELGPKGLVVLAVPSNDFNQELATAAEVQEFCEVQYGLTLPMTDITRVRGERAHPFYKWLAEQGAVPTWNFNKALIGPEGALVSFHPSRVRPDSALLQREIRALLPQ